MNTELKITIIRELNEKGLREQVLLPLLSRMGFKAATVYHGPRERGKDIVCFENDRLGARQYMAVVAKTTDLDGSVSSSQGLREVLFQVEQCFDVAYEDLFGMTRVTMDRVWVVTSRKIVSGAADSVYDYLAKRNLAKLVRFIPSEVLINLLDDYYPAFWDAATEPIDVLTEQKQKLASFVRQILIALGGEASDIDATINQIIHSISPPTVYIPPDRSLSRVSPYRVELDTISEQYSHGFFSPDCGVVKDAFFQAKKAVYYAMFDVEKIMDHYEAFMKKIDPHELIDEFKGSLSKEYPFWRASWGSAGDAARDIEYLRGGLNDIDALRENLDKIGKLDWATALVDSVYALEGEIRSFLSHVDKEEFILHWSIETENGKGRLSLVYDQELSSDQQGITTKHKRTIESHKFGRVQKRSVSVRDITDEVQYRLRECFDAMLSEHGFNGEDEF